MKIKRDAFLYMDPSGKNQAKFGQCATCRMAVPIKGKMRCSILDIEVGGNDSCGMYTPGPHNPSEAQHISKDVSPKDAGYVRRQVRCENCKFFDPDDGDCELFEMLNLYHPTIFDLEEMVDPRGCCNAQTPGPKVGESLE